MHFDFYDCEFYIEPFLTTMNITAFFCLSRDKKNKSQYNKSKQQIQEQKIHKQMRILQILLKTTLMSTQMKNKCNGRFHERYCLAILSINVRQVLSLPLSHIKIPQIKTKQTVWIAQLIQMKIEYKLSYRK